MQGTTDRISLMRRASSDIPGTLAQAALLCRLTRWHSWPMPPNPRRAFWFVAIALALGGGAVSQAIGGHGRASGRASHPRVTSRCPLSALPLRKPDLATLRRFGLALALHGVHKVGSRSIDYRDAYATARFPTFYTGYVRSACQRQPLVQRLPDRSHAARTRRLGADALTGLRADRISRVTFPHTGPGERFLV